MAATSIAASGALPDRPASLQPLLSHHWLPRSTLHGGRRRGAVALCCLVSVVQLAGAALNCKVEQGVCYQGTNLAVSFVGSVHAGCRELPGPTECCALCASYWPQCLSWQFIREGNAANGYNGMSFYCCLKTTFRPDPLSASYCESGYQNPRCTVTSACQLEVTGNNLEATDSLLISTGPTCGASGSVPAAWTGITNPKTATSVTASRSEFSVGSNPTGPVGEYSLCYRKGGNSASVANYTMPVGGFTMRGPAVNHSASCTLGQDCVVTIPGVDLRNDPARYFILLVVDAGSPTPCQAGATQASFLGLSNPDNVEDDNDDDTFRMGVGRAGDTTLSYAICWSENPSSFADYTYHLGSFVMFGPVQTTHACIMGSVCTLTLGGLGFKNTNAVLVGVGVDQFLCAGIINRLVANFDTTFANPSRVGGIAPYKNYTLGVPQLVSTSTPGSGYRVCWSDAPTLVPPARQLSDYKIDAGSFALLGPDAADQRCTLTLPCILTLTGFGLEQMDFGVLIVGVGQSCGNASATLAIVSGGNWTNPAAGSAAGVVRMGTGTAGLASASYVACWGAYPGGLGGYPVQLGSFRMAGPYVVASSSCIKGLACTLVLSGVGLADTNQILVLEPGGQCGISTDLTSFSPMHNQKVANNDGFYERYEMGFPNLGMAQAGYTLCWSADPGSTTDFSVTVGPFTVKGGNVLDVEISMSTPGEIQIIGHELSATNRLIVLFAGQCGNGQPTFASLTGLLTNVGVEASPPYNTYRLGTPVAGVPGVFRLCWAHNPASGPPDLYKVPVGMLTIRGPVQVAQHCTLSIPCVLQLTGTGLNTSNRVLIIASTSSCGDASPTVATFFGITNPQGPVASNASTMGLYEMGTGGSAPGGVGASYRICWSHSPDSLADYRVTLGTFTVSGPILGTLVHCILGLPCSVRVTGHNFASTNKIIIASILDTCGQTSLQLAQFDGLTNPASVTGSSPWHDYDLSTPTRGVPGDYAVCWSHLGGGHAEYDVRIATLRMAGPAPADRECTLSEPCRVPLDGVRLAHTSKLLIIARSSTCGEAAPELGIWSGMNNPGTALIQAPGNPGYNLADGDTYNLGLPFANPPSTTYQMCWAFDPTAAGGFSDYKVSVGNFIMNGPFQDLRGACTMGQPCNLRLTGWGLAATNRIQIVAGYGACGTSGVTQAVLSGIENPRLVTDDAYDDSYNLGMVIIGGAYSQCRVAIPAPSCIGNHYRVCWAHGVHTTTSGEPNYVVDIGTFAMSGPFVTYSVECTLGIICAFQLYGSEFRRSNRVLIIEEHGSCGSENPPVVHFAGLYNPMTVGEVTGGSTEATFRLGRSTGGKLGTYRLCWAHDPLVMRHYNIEVGPFIFHGLSSECSVSDPFSVECAQPS